MHCNAESLIAVSPVACRATARVGGRCSRICYRARLGGDPVVTAMNTDKWTSLSPKTQSLTQTRVTEDFAPLGQAAIDEDA